MSSISVLSALLLNKLHLKIVWAFTSCTLWLFVMTSPDYLVVKFKIIFRKGPVPKMSNTIVCCSILTVQALCMHRGVGMEFTSTSEVQTLMSHPTLPWYSCLWCHTERREEHTPQSDHRISDIGKGDTCQWISHPWVQSCHSWFKSGLVVSTNTAGQGHSMKSLSFIMGLLIIILRVSWF